MHLLNNSACISVMNGAYGCIPIPDNTQADPGVRQPGVEASWCEHAGSCGSGVDRQAAAQRHQQEGQYIGDLLIC